MRKQASRINVRLRYREMFKSPGGSHGKKLVVVLGNCQAEPLGRMLQSDPAFAEEFQFVETPPVHAIRPGYIAPFLKLLERADVILTQSVRDDYRGLPIGTNQLLRNVREGAQVITYPVLYYEGLYPFQVYLRHSGDISEVAPLTRYADVRTISFAARGLTDNQAVEEFKSFRPTPDSILSVHETSIAQLNARESELDIRVATELADWKYPSPSFFTVNHPSNHVILAVARQVRAQLGFDTPETLELKFSSLPDPLAETKTPIERCTKLALGISYGDEDSWSVGAKTYGRDEVVRTHMAWLRANPAFVRSGVSRHAERIGLLGLT
ncbi:MAG: WcbI family polysaccharide biosynthesis putative acetyltransferase [Solirubrobacterales bacterium]